MQKLPLTFRDGHLFVTFGEHDWLLDTGAPTSFGNISTLVIENRIFRFSESYMELTAAKLSEFVGSTVGIIGADVLHVFDILFDTPKREVSFSDAPLKLDGIVIKTD